MSKLGEVVTKIKVKMNKNNSRKIELLPYCPAVPRTIKSMCQENAVQSKNMVSKSEKINDGDMWKISWMTEYNLTRHMLDKQSKSIIEKSKEIDSLKESNRKNAKLVLEFAKRLKNKNIIIQQLAQHCLVNGLYSEKTSTETASETAPKTYQTIGGEPEFESPEFESIKQKATQNSIDASNCDKYIEMENDTKQTEESEIVTNSKKTVVTKRASIQYLCPHCSYYTTKKSSMDDHVAEFCGNPPVKNMQCKICFKMFTRRGLRIHFNNFTKEKHSSRGGHADFTPEDHEFFKVAALNGFEYP